MEILCKAAPLLSDELLADAVPLAWEVLLDDCQQLASAAGKLISARDNEMLSLVMFLLILDIKIAGNDVDCDEK